MYPSTRGVLEQSINYLGEMTNEDMDQQADSCRGNCRCVCGSSRFGTDAARSETASRSARCGSAAGARSGSSGAAGGGEDRAQDGVWQQDLQTRMYECHVL